MSLNFGELDVHDERLVNLSVSPSVDGEGDLLAVRLHRHWEGLFHLIEFQGCGNVEFKVDFDVLRDNAPINTLGAFVERDPETLREFAMSFDSVWNVTYESGMRRPVEGKLQALSEYSTFELKFFGGLLKVLARGVKVSEEHGT